MTGRFGGAAGKPVPSVRTCVKTPPNNTIFRAAGSYIEDTGGDALSAVRTYSGGVAGDALCARF